MFYNLNRRALYVLFLLISMVTVAAAHTVENTQSWSDWFASKVEQYKKAAVAWSPQCKIVGDSATSELSKKPYVVGRALDTKFGGRQTVAWTLAFDLIKSLGCLSATAGGAAVGITKEMVSDMAYKLFTILELYDRGEISQKQAQAAIEEVVSNEQKLENLA